jgi:hypothetical protein
VVFRKKLNAFFSNNRNNSNNSNNSNNMVRRQRQQQQQQQRQQRERHAEIPIRVQGANELKAFLQMFGTLCQNVRDEFATDLQNPLAQVAFNKSSVGSFEFHATMCRVSHNDFIHRLQLHGEFTAGDSALTSCCAQLEIIRKMLVTNKQDKTTNTNQLQRTIRAVRAALRTDCSLEPEQEPDCIIQLQLQKEKVKQHHKTVSRNLLEHAHLIIVSCWRHIHAQKIAAQDTIGTIIHHAEKCRAFITKCQHLASIEKSTAEWWFEAHPEHANDHRVSISPGETFNSLHLKFKASDPFQFTATLPLHIIVHDPQCNQVFNGTMDPTLADAIF